MDRQYRFEDERVQSPFDQSQINQQGPAPSFKTDLNRNKTQKWAQAKQYNYDGDDWGDLDPYDEYGGYGESSTTQQQYEQPRQQSAEREGGRRNLSAGAQPVQAQHQGYNTVQQAYGQPPTMSEVDDRSQYARPGRRDFSQPAQMPQPLHAHASPSPNRPPTTGSAFPPRKSSKGQQDSPGEFQTTQTSTSTDKPLPANVPFIRPADIYKRMQQEQQRERSSTDSARPSMDSIQRPSTEVNDPTRKSTYPEGPQRTNPANLDPVTETSEPSRVPGLEYVSRGQYQTQSNDLPQQPEQLPQDTYHTPQKSQQLDRQQEDTPERYAPIATTLPRVSRIASGFGSDFWSAAPFSPEKPRQEPESSNAQSWREGMLQPREEEESQPSATLSPNRGLQSVVTQAFQREDDGSVPPTPVSYSQSSDVSRSNTDSTAGISPIMSRVPSAPTTDSRQRSADSRDMSVRPIAEESSYGGIMTGPSATTSHQPAISGHSRNTSGDTVVPSRRQELRSPSPQGSPARSAEYASTHRMSRGMTAEISQPQESQRLARAPATDCGSESYSTDESMSDYATREADITRNIPQMSGSNPLAISAATESAQTNFLRLHKTPEPESPPAVRSYTRSPGPLASLAAGRQSPAPGRVRDLADKYNGIQDLSRKNSQTSLTSRGSVSSWKQGDEPLSLKRTQTLSSPLGSPIMEGKSAGATGGLEPRPKVNAQPSFRPHLPGEWVSTTDLGSAYASREEPVQNTLSEQDPDISTAAERTEQADFSPTTAKRPLRQVSTEPESTTSSPVDVLKAAGAALGASILGSVSGNHKSRDFAQTSEPKDEGRPVEEARSRSGNVHMKPLFPSMNDASAASSVAPTPPAKDTPTATQTDRSSSYFPRIQEPINVRTTSYTSTDDGFEEMESDRLRREIERSLTPTPRKHYVDDEDDMDDWERDDDDDRESMNDQLQREQDALDAPRNLQVHKQNDNIPAEPVVAAMPHQHEQQVVPPTIIQTRTSEDSAASHPGLLDQRFSWENRQNRESGVGYFNPAGLANELDRPRTPLHVVNTTINEDDEDSPEFQKALPADPPSHEAQFDPEAVTAPVQEMKDMDGAPGVETADVAKRANGSEASEVDRGLTTPVAELPSDPLDEASRNQLRQSGATTTSTDGQPRIAPFREILAIRDSHDRIDTYNTTRQQFAGMDTGLRNWLSVTLAANPEHNHLVTDGPSQLSNSASIRYKSGPSILKIAKGLGSSRNDSDQAVTSPDGSQYPNPYAVNVDKMSSKGKDILSSAGKLGGKGMVGAKGWLAKGRQKLRESGGGTDKEHPSTSFRNSLSIPKSAVSSDQARPSVGPSTEKATVPTPRPLKEGGSRTSSRLSMTFDKIRSVSERSGSRSRPQSMIVGDSRTGLPQFLVEEMPTNTYKESPKGDMGPTTAGLGSAASAATAIWAAPWNHDYGSPTTPRQTDSGTWRLGVLPSPGVETSASVGSDTTFDALHANNAELEAKSTPNEAAVTTSGKDIEAVNVEPASIPVEPITSTEKHYVDSPSTEPRSMPALAAMTTDRGYLDHVDTEHESRPAVASMTTERPYLGHVDTEPRAIPAVAAINFIPQRQDEDDDELDAVSPSGDRSMRYSTIPEYKAELPAETRSTRHPETAVDPTYGSDSSVNSGPGTGKPRDGGMPNDTRIYKDQGVGSMTDVKRDTPMLLSDESWTAPVARQETQGHRRGQPSIVSQLKPPTFGDEATSRDSSVSSLNETANVAGPATSAGYRDIRVSHDASLMRQDALNRDENRRSLVEPKREASGRAFDVDSPTLPEFMHMGHPQSMAAAANTDRYETPSAKSRVEQDELFSAVHPAGGVLQPPMSNETGRDVRPSDPVTSRSVYAAADLEVGQEQLRPFHQTPSPEYHTTSPRRVSEGYPPGPPQGRFPPMPDMIPHGQSRAPANVYRARGHELPVLQPLQTDTYQTNSGHGTHELSPQEAEAGFVVRGAAPSLQSSPRATKDERSSRLSMSRRALSNDMEQPSTSSAKSPRRRSSVWSSFSRSSTKGNDSIPTEPVPNIDGSSYSAMTPAQKASENTDKAKLVRKSQPPLVQRNSSSATQPDADKKRRFSGLGALFGRSKSTAQEPVKPRNRLSKVSTSTQGDGNSSRQSSAGFAQHQEYRPVPQPSGYSYLSEDPMSTGSRPSGSRRSSSRYTSQGVLPPIPDLPAPNRAYDQREPTLPDVQPTRRLRSEKLEQNRFSYMDVPEAFQPTDASFVTGAPPASHSPPPPLPSSIPPHLQQRHSSAGTVSTISQMSSHDQVRRDSTPISPISTNTPQPAMNRQRMNSLSHVIGVRPVQEPSTAEMYGSQTPSRTPPPRQKSRGPDPSRRNTKSPVTSPTLSTQNQYSQDRQGYGQLQYAKQPGPPQQSSTPGMYHGYSEQSGRPVRSSMQPQPELRDQDYPGQSPSQAGRFASDGLPQDSAYPGRTQGAGQDMYQRQQHYNEAERYNPGRNEYQHQQREPVSRGPPRSQQNERQMSDQQLLPSQRHRHAPATQKIAPQGAQYGYRYQDEANKHAYQNSGVERQTSDDSVRAQMNSTAYPGQEWTPMGVEEGRYQWE